MFRSTDNKSQSRQPSGDDHLMAYLPAQPAATALPYKLATSQRVPTAAATAGAQPT